MTKHKPSEIKVGAAYRMKRVFSEAPSDEIRLVTAIVQVTKTSRIVKFELLHGRAVWTSDNYSNFMRRVWSEEPLLIQ
jgi:hypothetical protein